MSATAARSFDPWRLPALSLGIVAGAIMAGQSRMNGELSRVWAEPIIAALWSFGSGFAVLCVLVVVVGPARVGVGRVFAAVRGGQLSWWQCAGGMFGGLFVVAQSVTVPIAGVALFTMAVVAGQTLGGLVVDRLGMGANGKTAVTLLRVVAAVLAVLGVVVATSGAVVSLVWAVVLPVVVSVFIGVGTSIQTATNGRMNLWSRHVVATTFVNFGFGAVTIFAVFLGQLVFGQVRLSGFAVPPWWSLGGGVCGILFISAASWAVRHVGVLAYLIAANTSLVSCAVLLDVFFPVGESAQVTAVLVLGVSVSVLAIALASRRPAAASQGGSSGT